MSDKNNGFIEEELQEGDDILTLHTQSGEEVNFIEVAEVLVNGDFFAIVQPVELLEGMGPDEALVFRIDINDQGYEEYFLVVDDETIDAAFKEYYKLYEEAMADEE